MLSNIVASELDLREIARPHLVALRDRTRETTQIAILDHWQVVYLERVPSLQPVGFMHARTGGILPAYCTALGKTLLAFEPYHEVAAWAARQRFAALTPHTITSARRLLKELRVTRERGYGLDEQERELGVRCIAAPVHNHEGRVVAAISVAGPTERLPRTLAGSDVAAAVAAAAHATSLDLGAGLLAGEAAALPAHGGRR